MSDLRVSIIARLVNRVKGPAREVRGDIASIEGASRRVERSGNRAGRTQQRLGALSVMAGRAALGATLAAGTAATASVANAARLQDAWSEANKTLGLSAGPLQDLRGEIERLSVEIPLANGSMVDIVATAGQLGIRGQAAIVEFTRDTAKMAATFDVSAGRAAEMQASWREQMSFTQDQVRMTADQINHLGNTTAAESARVAEFYTSIAGIAEEAGMSREEVLALGAAMIASGRAPEVASTGMRALFRTMNKGWGDLSDRQSEAADRLGLGGERWNAIQQRMATDSAGAVRQIVAAISELPEHERTAAAGVLFGEEAGRALGALLVNVDKLDGALSRIPELQSAAGSMNAEYLALSDDVLDNWRRVKTALAQRGTRFGSTILDPLNDGLKSFLRLLQTADQRIGIFERIGQFSSGLMDGVGIDPARIEAVMSRIRSALTSLIFGAEGDPGEVLAKVYQNARNLGDRLAPVVETISNNITTLVDGLRPLFNTMRDWTKSEEGRAAMDATVASVVNIATALGTLAGAAIEAGTAAVTGFFTSVVDHIGPIMERVRGITTQLEPITEHLVSIVNSIINVGSDDGDGMQRLGAFLGDLVGITGRIVATSLEAVARALETILGVVAAVLQGDFGQAWAELKEFFDWLKNLVVEGLNMGELFDWPEPPKWLRWLMGEGETTELPGIDVTSIDGFASASGEQQAAMRRIANAQSAGELPVAGKIVELREHAAALNREIADTQARIESFGAGPQAGILAQVENENLARLQSELAAIETQLETAETQAASLIEDMRTLGLTEVNLKINDAALTRALRNAQALERSKNRLNGGTGTAASSTTVQARARGGIYRTGWRLVGENGPELEYQNVGGFIAHNAQLRRMADLSERVARAKRSISISGSGVRAAAAPRTARSFGPVTIHITQLPGQNARALAKEVLREMKRAEGGALHDGGDYD